MKEENENNKTVRTVEYAMVIIVLLIVLIIILPSLNKIIYNMSKDSAVTSTKNTIDTVKTIYTNMNLKNEVALPFKAVFSKDGYTLYENGKKVNYELTVNIKIEGKKPKSGSITITEDGTVTVKDLTYGNIKCNQIKDKELICEKW